MVLVWFSLVFRLKNWKVTRGGDFLQFFFEIFLRGVTFLKSEKVGREYLIYFSFLGGDFTCKKTCFTARPITKEKT